LSPGELKYSESVQNSELFLRARTKRDREILWETACYTLFPMFQHFRSLLIKYNLSPHRIKYSEETVMFRILLRARTKKNEANPLRYDEVMAKTSAPVVSIIVLIAKNKFPLTQNTCQGMKQECRIQDSGSKYLWEFYGQI
jgi:hypothetical protein